MEKSAGVIIITIVPGMGGKVAILQVHGTFNHERMAAESYPGACQVTAHGKSENVSHSHLDIVRRELEEELGSKAAQMISKYLDENCLISATTVKEDVKTYAVGVPSEFLVHVVLNASTGGLRLVTEKQIKDIKNLREFDKTTGVIDRNVIAMFPDEIEAVRLAFQKIQVTHVAKL